MLLVAIVLAVLVGLSLGLLGGGGSILTVPILRYVLGLDAHRAIALSLLVVGTTSLAAIVPHARQGRVDWRTGVAFGSAAMIGAYLAGSVAELIPSGVLLIVFGIVMFATAVAMLRNAPERSVPSARSKSLPLLKVLGEGLVVGAVTGLVGAGGGFLVVPALVLLGGLPMPIAIGTSLLVIAMKSFAGFAGFLGHTPVDWTLGIAVSAAAIVGSVTGSLIATRVPARALRAGFGWFVVAMAFFILAQELPPLLGIAVSLWLALLTAAIGTAGMVGLRTVARGVTRRFTPASEVATTAQLPVGTERVTPELGGKP
jgi:uncharacterized membrane protein YfcA